MQKFVFLDYFRHRIFREITKSCPLTPSDYSNTIAFQLETLDDATFETITERSKYKFDQTKNHFLRESGGINICTKKVKLPFSENAFRSGGYRLIQHPTQDHNSYDCCTALEPLIYGIGVLRDARTDQTSFERILGGVPLPKIDSDYVTRTIFQKGKYTYESTNIIYADSYGELEQIWERRKDTAFVKLYLENLLDVHRQVTQEGMMDYLYDFCDWKKRVQNGIWKTPPTTPNDLLSRVEFILSSTVTDHLPKEVLEYEHQNLWGKIPGRPCESIQPQAR